MTNEQQTETTNAEGESGSEDSPVFRELRKKFEETQKENKALTEKLANQEAEIRATLERDNAISSELGRLGYPSGILDVVKDKLGESEVNTQSVVEALKGIGFEVSETDPTSEDTQEEAVSEQHANLANVTGLSAQVADAAKGRTQVDVSQAETPEQIVEMMQKQGLLQSHI